MLINWLLEVLGVRPRRADFSHIPNKPFPKAGGKYV
jgi:hypothetical protein